MTTPFLRVLISASAVSLLSQVLGLSRQLLIISSFGISRQLDIYQTLYAYLSMTVLPVATIVDVVFVGLLGQFRAAHDERRMRGAIRTFMMVGLSTALVGAVVAGLMFPVLIQPFIAGFTPSEQHTLFEQAPMFLPWAAAALLYSALGACAKSRREFHRFFAAELVVTAVSTSSIAMFHGDIAEVALCFAGGYTVAVMYLAYHLVAQTAGAGLEPFPWRTYAGRVAKHFASNQVGTLYSLVERYWYSFLPAGGIGVLSIVQQLTMNLSSLLTFRDAYLVPLSDEAGRDKKLSRLLCGLFLVAVAMAGAILVLAEPLCRILFQYGKVSENDISLLTAVLSIAMVNLVAASISTPVWRFQQMTGQYRPVAVVYLQLAVTSAILGQLLIGWLGFGTVAMAAIGAFNATWVSLVALYHAKRYGASMTRSQWQVLAISACACAGAGLITAVAIRPWSGMPLALPIGGAIYGVVMMGYVFANWRKLDAFIRP